MLMLHAFNYTFPATSLIAEAVRKRLQERTRNRSRSMLNFLIWPEIPTKRANCERRLTSATSMDNAHPIW